MLTHYPHVSLTIYVQDGWRGLLEYLLAPGPRLIYKNLSEAPWALKKPYIEFDQNRLTSLNLHLTDHAFLILMDMLPPTQADKAYERAKMVPLLQNRTPFHALYQDKAKPYICFTTDYTAPSRQWPACHINALARRCREAGLTPVLLGTTKPIPTGIQDDPVNPRANDGVDASLFIDLRDKTTLLEALGVIQRARAVVGIDNGLLHLAHCTDVPVVMGFTTLKPEHRMPVREMFKSNGEKVLPGCHDLGRAAALTETLTAQVPCGGCQSRGFAINHDWRTCIFDDYACTLTLTAERFWTRLKKLGVVE
jgi:ADP-heptose:LPS heptosyltransferase